MAKKILTKTNITSDFLLSEAQKSAFNPIVNAFEKNSEFSKLAELK